MRALAERLEERLLGTSLTSYRVFGFSGLKTADPPPESVIGNPIMSFRTRGKYLVARFENRSRMLVHLSQAGRLDIEEPPKASKPRGSVARLLFANDIALLLREYGTEHKAGWWILRPGDEGPLERLGPEADSDEFAELIRASEDGRRVHTILRDQKTVAGIGRGYSDDALHGANLSPYATLKSLSDDERDRLVESIRETLNTALDKERQRSGGLSEAKLGEHFTVHGRAGSPCPRCGETLLRVSYESHEVAYCPACQTEGRVLADRRMSRLLK